MCCGPIDFNSTELCWIDSSIISTLQERALLFSAYSRKKKSKKTSIQYEIRRELHFFSFQMNCFSFTEIPIRKKKKRLNLLEIMRNNLVNFEQTLISKFVRCCLHLAEEFHIFEHVNIIHFFSSHLVMLPTVSSKILLPKMTRQTVLK